MPTDAEMLERLKLDRLKMLASGTIKTDGFTPLLWPSDVEVLRWALATMERYRGALDKYANHTTSCLAEPSNPAWTGECNCGVGDLLKQIAALSPDPPAPAETEAKR